MNLETFCRGGESTRTYINIKFIIVLFRNIGIIILYVCYDSMAVILIRSNYSTDANRLKYLTVQSYVIY